MNVVAIGWRNLARNRRRTALSLGLVACGTAALIVTAGFVRFSFDGLREAMIHGGLGHLEIADAGEVARRGAGALDRQPSPALEEWREIRSAIERLPHVVAVGANLHLLGLVRRGDGPALAFVGVGVEPDRERRMGFTTRLRAGRGLDAAPTAAGEDPVLLAAGLASALGAAPGETVTLVAARADGMLNAMDVRVAGTYTTGVAELDTRLLKLPLASAARLAETARVSNLLVALDRTAATGEAAAAVARELAGRPAALAVTPWEARAPFYAQVRGLYTGIFRFLGTIVALLVVLAASNTLVMTVFERLRELGTLRALGATRGQVAGLLLAEAAWLGLAGGALGALVGGAAVAGVNALGLTLPPPPGAVEPIDLALVLVPEAFAGAVALMVVVLLLAAVVPILRAGRVAVVDALRHS